MSLLRSRTLMIRLESLASQFLRFSRLRTVLATLTISFVLLVMMVSSLITKNSADQLILKSPIAQSTMPNNNVFSVWMGSTRPWITPSVSCSLSCQMSLLLATFSASNVPRDITAQIAPMIFWTKLDFWITGKLWLGWLEWWCQDKTLQLTTTNAFLTTFLSV